MGKPISPRINIHQKRKGLVSSSLFPIDHFQGISFQASKILKVVPDVQKRELLKEPLSPISRTKNQNQNKIHLYYLILKLMLSKYDFITDPYP